MEEKLLGENKGIAEAAEDTKNHDSSAEIRRITLDAARMTARISLHTYLREKMELPGHYGENLDALYDVLTDIMVETEIRLDHVEALQNTEPFGLSVLRVFREAAQENGCLTLTENITEKGENE